MINTSMTEFHGEKIQFVELVKVKEGVSCEVYKFTTTEEKDFALVTVQSGFSTPLQKIISGDKTIEGHMQGHGTLTITDAGESTEYIYPADKGDGQVEVKVGQTMQWKASGDNNLIFYEICYLPYQDGRYKNL